MADRIVADEVLPFPGEVVHMAVATGPCDTHEWPTAGVHRRLVAEMRARHGKGGVNVCHVCWRFCASCVRDMSERIDPQTEESGNGG